MKLSTGRSSSIHIPKQSAKTIASQVHSNVLDQAMQDQSSIEPADQSQDIDPSVLDAATQEADAQQKYGDLTGTALASGVAEGLLPGADVIATHLGVDPELLKRAREQSPIAHGIGEAAGLAGGALATGGENVLAKATLGGAAHVAEEGLAKALGEGLFKSAAEKSIARKIAEKSLEKGIAAGTVGAGFGVNELLNENALGAADLTGENLVAYAGTGAILNGLVGGAFGAAEAISPIAKPKIDQATEQMKQVFGKDVDLDSNIVGRFAATTGEKRALANELKGFTDEEKVNFLADDLGLKLADVSDKAVYEKFNKTGEDLGNIQRGVYEQADKLAADKAIPTSETHLELNNALNDYVSQNANEFDSSAAKSAVKQVQKELDNRIARLGTGKFESATDFWDAVKTWGQKGYQESDNVKADLYKALNSKAREILQNNIERVTAGTDAAGALDTLKATNKKFQLWYALKRGMETKSIKDKGFIGLKGYVAGALGHAIGGPIGGAAAILGSKLLSSDLKRNFIILNTAERANMQGAKKIASGLGDFFSGAGKASAQMARTLPKMSLMNSGWAVGEKNKKPQSEDQAFSNISKNLVNLSVNPDKLATKIAYNTMRAGYAAPNATRFAQVTLSKATQFLYDKMPKTAQADSLFPKEYKPSSLDMAKFQRYVQAVENPYSVVEELKAGTLTKEHVEALQTVYPAIYGEIQHQTSAYIAKHPDLSYSKKVQLGTLLHMPTDPSMQPSAVIALQSNFQTQPEQGGGQGGGAVKSTVGGMKQLNFSDRSKTELQKSAAGENRK